MARKNRVHPGLANYSPRGACSGNKFLRAWTVYFCAPTFSYEAFVAYSPSKLTVKSFLLSNDFSLDRLLHTVYAQPTIIV
jgi:hypothetical protein